MKIGLPDNNPNRNNSNKSNKKKKNYKRGGNNAGKNPNHGKQKKNQNNKPKEKKDISWREKDGFITAIISRKLIKIDIKTFTIYLPNGFSMKAKSLEQAKKKAIEFLS